MFPPFPQEIARHYCQEIISDLQDGFLSLNQISQESEERKGHGVMLGALVCADKNTNERVVLITNSGISAELITAENQKYYLKKGEKHIIVPAIADPKLIENALKANDKEIHILTEKINLLREELLRSKGTEQIERSKGTEQTVEQTVDLAKEKDLKALVDKRTALTDESLQNVFNLYEFTDFRGNKISLKKIIEIHKNNLPPTGTGDCCAPKLLSYAFSNNLIPLSMDEVFYGKNTKNKINGVSYGPCDERCGYILPHILGLEIIYRDSEIIVVNKPSGLLSVPGRTEDKQDCVVNRVKALFPACIKQPSVHRLDMETSGLLVLAFTEKSHAALSRQFEEGNVHKRYCAILDGVLEKAEGYNAPKKGESNGVMKLKFRLDTENRPHQIYDEVYGKEGITQWHKEGTFVLHEGNEKRHVTKVIFTPLTGRTHQLRLAASDIHGFGLPIVGDSLYGVCRDGERLMLNAFELSFLHPISGKRLQYSLISDKF